MEEAELVAAGLYDPDAPDAAQRWELFTFLEAQGAGVDEIVEAAAASNLSSLALDLRMRRGAVSAAELATAAGMTVDRVREVYRLLGVAVPDADERRFTTAEVELLELASLAAEVLPDGTPEEILRSVGTGLAVIAESTVSAFVGSVEDLLEQVSPRSRAEATLGVGDLALRLGDQLGPLLRHHLVVATDRQRASMVAAPDRRHSTFTVGFVDLVGFTSATGAMSPDDLLAFMREFHGRTFDVVTGLGGRVVKHIGDEVMFSALDAGQGCAIALDLVEAFDDGREAPRGGLAAGWVVARHGDLYGPVVNLASRLADAAIPGEVLAHADLSDAASGARVRWEPAGRRQLKGFAEPTPVVSLLRPDVSR